MSSDFIALQVPWSQTSLVEYHHLSDRKLVKKMYTLMTRGKKKSLTVACDLWSHRQDPVMRTSDLTWENCRATVGTLQCFKLMKEPGWKDESCDGFLVLFYFCCCCFYPFMMGLLRLREDWQTLLGMYCVFRKVHTYSAFRQCLHSTFRVLSKTLLQRTWYWTVSCWTLKSGESKSFVSSSCWRTFILN